jgi:sucrose-6-phosphate hydrolase SacC (GH32 family)
LFHVRAEVNIPAGARLIFNLRGIPVILTSKTVESGSAPATVADQIKTVEILMDRTSIEVFVNHGEISSTRFVLPHENGLAAKAEGASVTIQSLTVCPLIPAWADASEGLSH